MDQRSRTAYSNGFLALTITALIACGVLRPAWGATAFWTGVNGGYWSAAGGNNWSSTAAYPGVGYTPVNGDSLRWFGSSDSGGRLSSTNDITGLSVAGISFQGADKPYTLSGNKLTLTGGISFGANGGAHTFNLPLELNANMTVDGGSGTDVLTINGDITETNGSRTVSIQSGNVALYGSNTFSGVEMIVGVSADNTAVIANTLANTNTAQSLGKIQRLRLGHGGNNGILIYDGSVNAVTDRPLQIGRIDGNNSGSAVVRNNGAGTITWNGAQYTAGAAASVTRTLTLGGTNTGDNTWAAEIKNNKTDALIALVKEDSGKWILSANNTYDGPTTVSKGTLVVNGNQSGATGAVAVAGGTLGGTGTIGGTVSVSAGAALAPGNAGVGTLTVTGAVTLAEGAVYQWECQNGVGDCVALTGPGGTLTLPGVATVLASQVSGELPSPAALFTATTLAGATDLSGWTVSGITGGGKVEIQGTSVILKTGINGTLLRIR